MAKKLPPRFYTKKPKRNFKFSALLSENKLVGAAKNELKPGPAFTQFEAKMAAF